MSGMQRRSLKALFTRPEFRVKSAFIVVGGGLLSLAGMIFVLSFQIRQTVTQLEQYNLLAPEAAILLNQTLQSGLIIFFTIAGLLALFSLVMSIRISHRIFGPMIAVKKYIERLENGEQPEPLRLRKNDEFAEIADALNRLNEKLSKKSFK